MNNPFKITIVLKLNYICIFNSFVCLFNLFLYIS